MTTDKPNGDEDADSQGIECTSHASTPHKCRTAFVSDLPALTDSFATNKAYGRIVSAIVDIVRSKTSDDGMSIGVEGSWGAGKTTIINLLREEFRNLPEENQSEGNRPILLISFDAWAHEGDPLRLTFLETLTDNLVSESWVDSDKWVEQLDIISRRKDIRESATDFGLTWFDGVIAFSFFLIPIGVAVLTAALRSDITFDIGRPVAWKFVVGVLLCIAAPGLIVFKLAGKWLQNRVTRSNASLEGKEPRATKQSFLALLLNRTFSADRTVIVKTPEPTSLEFEKQFKDLMHDALDGHRERRVILVIDNLDRVQTKEAIAIWSTLQTFLQHRHHNPPSWLRQLHTIVLYDPARMREHPGAGNKISENGDSFDSRSSYPALDEQVEGSLLDKSFQIRLEVPPPVLSDWRGYLLELLENALPDHNAVDYHNIYRILAIHRHKRPPTIRELKVYVNQICAIHLQWQDSFPLTHVAYYVLLKRRHEEIVAGLFGGRFPESEYSGMVGEDVRDTIAALTFNVEQNIAYQILLENPIQEALSELDGTKLSELASSFRSGFWEALENVVSKGWAGEQSAKVAIGILSLEQSGLLRTTGRPEPRSVQNALSHIAFAMKSWKPFNEDIAKGVSVLGRWRRLAGPNHDAAGSDITKLMEAIAEGLFDRNPSFRSNINVPNWLSALNIVVETNRTLGFVDLGRDIVIKKIRSRLQACDHIEPEEISRLLEVLVELDSVDMTSGETLRALADGGQMLHYFNYAHQGARAYTATSWCILALLCFPPSIEPPQSVGNSASGYTALLELFKKPDLAVVQEFSKLMIRYKERLTIETMKRISAAEEFLAECLKYLAREGFGESFFTADLMLTNWAFFRERLTSWQQASDGGAGILARLANNPDLVDGLQSKGFQSAYAEIYRMLVENAQSDTSVFREWCRDNLESMTTADWSSDIDAHSELVHLALAIQKTGTSLNLGEQFQNAIVDNAERALNQDVGHPFLGLFDMGFLLEPLGNAQRLSVCRRIYDTVKQMKGKLPKAFLSSYGKFISFPEILDFDEKTITSIFKPTVENRDESDLKWLARLLIDNPSLFENCATQPVADFKRAVFVALSKPSDAVTPLISELASAMGLKNLNELPLLPWTVETLGEPLYKLIAKQGGYFDPDREPENYRPSLGALGVLDPNDNPK